MPTTDPKHYIYTGNADDTLGTGALDFGDVQLEIGGDPVELTYAQVTKAQFYGAVLAEVEIKDPLKGLDKAGLAAKAEELELDTSGTKDDLEARVREAQPDAPVQYELVEPDAPTGDQPATATTSSSSPAPASSQTAGSGTAGTASAS